MRKISKSKKSLRTILMFWFIIFSVVPLTFITGYSLIKYEEAIDQELKKRLLANQREIEVILSQLYDNLLNQARSHAEDKSLIYQLARGSYSQTRLQAKQWIGPLLQRVFVFDQQLRCVVALELDAEGKVVHRKDLERSIELSQDVVDKMLAERNQKEQLNVVKSDRAEMIVLSRIRSPSGKTVGYIEETIYFDHGFLNKMQERHGAQVVLISADGANSVASHEDLELYNPKFFLDQMRDGQMRDEQKGLFEINIQGEPYGFLIRQVEMGNGSYLLATGASRKGSREILSNINYAFLSIFFLIIGLLIVLSLVISKLVLRPLNELVEATRNLDPETGGRVDLKGVKDTEIGLLAETFNEMFERVHTTQTELKDKIKQLESANNEIRDTQAKLVHTAKMASLGQLVAGIAHELNNPIGFIYSNMAHLRDYSERLVHLVVAAEDGSTGLNKKKAEYEFEYIREDMPKLIKSCEDGARRTRDIVLGLRNFSRLEEAKLQKIILQESIETTLGLLRGELKNRIKVTTTFDQVPAISGYPSQLNQVFMNILSNAAQAINGEGEISVHISKKNKSHVLISIKDSGKGMDQETADKIFDPFFTTKSVGQGTGLGLSISYGIIQKHKGEITVNSSIGNGTEFVITLPIAGPEGEIHE